MFKDLDRKNRIGGAIRRRNSAIWANLQFGLAIQIRATIGDSPFLKDTSIGLRPAAEVDKPRSSGKARCAVSADLPFK